MSRLACPDIDSLQFFYGSLTCCCLILKVGGRNTVLVDALSRRIPMVTDRPTIIFGADVTHPHPGEDSSPSIAAVSKISVHEYVLLSLDFVWKDFRFFAKKSLYCCLVGCSLPRLAWGHEVCRASFCSGAPARVDRGFVQGLARSTEGNSQWWHD
jgi:hypothetical protein